MGWVEIVIAKPKIHGCRKITCPKLLDGETSRYWTSSKFKHSRGRMNFPKVPRLWLWTKESQKYGNYPKVMEVALVGPDQ